MRTEEFFDLVASGELSDLDIDNHIQSITGGYDEDKLNLLCKDYDEFISMRFEEWHGSFSREQIDKRIAKLQESGKKLPVRSDETPKDKLVFVSDFFMKTRYGKEVSDEEYKKGIKELFGANHISDDSVIDNNVLLGGFYFSLSNIYLKKLRDSLVKSKRRHTSATYRFDDELPIQKNGKDTDDLNYSSKGISFSVLNRIIYLTNLWHHGDKSIIEKLLNQNTTDFVEISEQFKKELKRNIVLTQSDSSLKRLIKHYLFEMNELYSSQNKIENLKSYRNAPNSHIEKYKSYLFTKVGDDEPTKANKFQNYILAKQEFLGIIFEVLRNNIFKTGISITQLTDEIKSSYSIHDEVLYELNSAKDFKDHFISKKNAKQNNYISWLNSDESRKQFIEALKENRLIKARETEAIINNHFKPQRDQNEEPEPIEWLSTKTLLAYMIEQLNDNYIHTDSIWVDTQSHFMWQGKPVEYLKSSAGNYRDNQTGRAGHHFGKPQNHEIIDSIIQNLPE